jgi:hypothetical protein
MPDFFDRLIARGTQQPGGRMPASGRPAHEADRASEPGSGDTVAFALPRLPGPFERPGAGPPGASLEAFDEISEVVAAPSATARARRALDSLAGPHAGVMTPPLLRGGTNSREPGSTSVPGEQLALPRATPLYFAADARAAALDQPFGRTSRPGHSVPPLSAPRTLAVPASAVSAARPVGDDAPGATAQPPAAPPVVVRIGRIEVRNASPERRERPAQRRTRRAAPKLTLAEYLAEASGRQNGRGVSAGGGR